MPSKRDDPDVPAWSAGSSGYVVPPWRAQPKNWELTDEMRDKYQHIPKRKREESLMAFAAFPKMQTKPNDFPLQRANASRSPGDRSSFHSTVEGDTRELPWDVRGPVGPEQGGPSRWRGQKYRQGSQRWANAGGQFREEFAFYSHKQRQGIRGSELAYFHPYNANGHFAREAWSRGELSPIEIKNRKNAEKAQQDAEATQRAWNAEATETASVAAAVDADAPTEPTSPSSVSI